MNLAALMAALLLAVGIAAGGYWQGHKHATTACTAATQTTAANSAHQAITNLGIARRQEHNQQEAINAALQTQSAEQDAVRARLDAALIRLRERPSRAATTSGVPAAAQPACAGATGAELSRPDAEFLEREAARAERQRAALKACYTAIDVGRPSGQRRPEEGAGQITP